LKEDEASQEINQRDYTLFRYCEGGNVENITPKKILEESMGSTDRPAFSYINSMGSDEAGHVIYTDEYNGEVYIYDPDMGERKVVTVPTSYGGMKVVGDKVYSYDGYSKISVAKLLTGEEIESIDYVRDFHSSIVMCTDSKGALYVINSCGIETFDENAKEWKVIIQGVDCQYGARGTMLCGVILKEGEQNEYDVLIGGEENYIDHIYFDTNFTAERAQKFSIFTLTQNTQLEMLVKAFKRSHPDVDVCINTMVQGPEEKIEEEKLKAMITGLLSGNGDDVYVLDGLPSESMIQKGVLENLTSVLGDQLTTGGLLENIVRAYQMDDGGIYELPARFAVPMYLYDAAIQKEDAGYDDLRQAFNTTSKAQSIV